MTARVFAYIIADDAESYTAGELSAGLRVSPAAISTAVRQLVQTGLVARERRPGERSDHYRIYDDDVWSAITVQRLPLLRRYEEILAAGLEGLDPARPGARRVRETMEYFRFMRAEFPQVAERWREYRRQHGLGRPD
ncbi:MarR family transcriptional regulator [Actinomadura craniellae]|uniref:MarR family transcriptional regulator n=2 Tax=Actinomadura craniellae TaxID=2231787 RepID=A0A365HDR2_9ACTN|nr:MarR family transcriptional regulator [Actinomadura craniellae]